jgi:hypothetical protein
MAGRVRPLPCAGVRRSNRAAAGEACISRRARDDSSCQQGLLCFIQHPNIAPQSPSSSPVVSTHRHGSSFRHDDASRAIRQIRRRCAGTQGMCLPRAIKLIVHIRIRTLVAHAWMTDAPSRALLCYAKFSTWRFRSRRRRRARCSSGWRPPASTRSIGGSRRASRGPSCPGSSPSSQVSRDHDQYAYVDPVYLALPFQ